MAKFIPDINTKRWVIISPQRSNRPNQVKDPKSSETIEKNGYNYNEECPFCLTHESKTPPEISRVVDPQDSNKWLVRVVPNKYPITDIHEVIIHSPDHIKDIAEFDAGHIETLVKVYRERYNALSPKGAVMIFNNKGKVSGESLVHPHSQVVIIPKQINLDVLTLEPAHNIVHENTHFVTFCPDFSQWPFETWIAQKGCLTEGHKGNCLFGAINDEQLTGLSHALQSVIKKLTNKFPDLSYNFYIYPYGCWYLRIIPRLTDRAGFELGTGLSVNTVDPSEAARELAGI